MTTAHQPTWHPAVGTSSSNRGHFSAMGAGASRQYSSRDLPGHTTLKTRTINPVRDFAAELASREAKARGEAAGGAGAGAGASAAAALGDKDPVLALGDKGGAGADAGAAGDAALLSLSADVTQFDDADDVLSGSDGDDSDSDSDSDGEELALMQELERIKREREEEAARTAAAEAQLEEQQAEAAAAAAAAGAGGAGRVGGVKRRWDDDVVFKNQANEKKKKHRFVNDTIRNDFHRKFMSKYIR